MAKGNTPRNAPSTTGNPSGGGRGNNQPKQSGGSGSKGDNSGSKRK
jgi:hypothetical protein